MSPRALRAIAVTWIAVLAVATVAAKLAYERGRMERELGLRP